MGCARKLATEVWDVSAWKCAPFPGLFLPHGKTLLTLMLEAARVFVNFIWTRLVAIQPCGTRCP